MEKGLQVVVEGRRINEGRGIGILWMLLIFWCISQQDRTQRCRSFP